MKYFIEKSNIPVLWLDTFAITQIAYAVFRKGQNQSYDEKLFNQFSELVQLRNAQKIIIFESDQLLEIAVRPELVKMGKQVLSQLSGGLVVHSYEAKKKQLIHALDAFAKSSIIDTIYWNDIYLEDPLKDRSIFGFLIRCDIGIDAKLRQKKQIDGLIYENWQKIRNQYAGNAAKTDFLKQYELEKSGGSKIAQDVISKVKDKTFTKYHPLYSELIEKPGLYLKARMPNIANCESIMIDFYNSSYFTSLPMNDIAFTLFAERLCGNEDIKQSDQADIENISAFLPYTNYMVIDRAMANKVNKHKLGEKYNTRLIRLKDINTVIEAAKATT